MTKDINELLKWKPLINMLKDKAFMLEEIPCGEVVLGGI